MKNRVVSVALIGLLAGIVPALGYLSWRSFATAGIDTYVLTPARELVSQPSPSGELVASISHVQRRRIGRPERDDVLVFRVKSVATGRELIWEGSIAGKSVQNRSAGGNIRWEDNTTVHFPYATTLLRSFVVRLPSAEF